jgi:hypothetical protein
MKVQDVITLEEGLEYLLLTEIEYEDKNYFLAVAVEDENIYIEDHFFCTTGHDEEGDFIDEVMDKDLIQKLYVLLATSEAIEEFPEIADKLLEGDSI